MAANFSPTCPTVAPCPAALAFERYRSWSVADTHAATLHPRWESFKQLGNVALDAGDYAGAIGQYTAALSLVDASNVAALFEALSMRPANSAGPMLAAAKDDIAPIIGQFVAGPVMAHGEPNKPAAICLANRASALLKAGRCEAAVADALAATSYCPEYLKGHYRLKQALLAAGAESAAAPPASIAPATSGVERLEASMERFRTLSLIHSDDDDDDTLFNPIGDADGRGGDGEPPPDPPGIWLGLRLVLCGWLPANTYRDVYEAPRARDWRQRAARCMAEDAAPMVHEIRRPPSWVGDLTASGAFRTSSVLRVCMEVTIST